MSFDALVNLNFGYRSGCSVADRVWPLPLELIYRPLKNYPTPEFSLWNRVFRSRNCLATDPRDNIFVLKSSIGPAQSEMEYLIDYTKIVEQSLIDVATFLLPVLGLRILTAIRHPHKRDMSSWISDLTQDYPVNGYYFLAESLEEELFPRPAPKLGSQSNQNHKIRPILTEGSSERPELCVTGCEYARIQVNCKVFMFSDTKDTKNQIKTLLSILGDSGRTAGEHGIANNCDVTDQLGKTITDDECKSHSARA